MNRFEALGLPARGDVLESVRQLLRLGDFTRLCNDAAADLVTGLTVSNLYYTARTYGVKVERPIVDRKTLCTAWPPPTAPYTPLGQLAEPEKVYAFPLVQIGYALTTPEVRAALLGLLDQGALNCEGTQRLYDTFSLLARGELQALSSRIESISKTITSTSTTTTVTITSNLPTAIMDGVGNPGDALRRKANHHVEVAAGLTQANQDTVIGLLGAPALDGQTISYYPTGSRTPPIATLPFGPVYRGNLGQATPAPTSGMASMRLGINSPQEGIDVILDSNFFQVP